MCVRDEGKKGMTVIASAFCVKRGDLKHCTVKTVKQINVRMRKNEKKKKNEKELFITSIQKV